jgi:hypothetical protein
MIRTVASADQPGTFGQQLGIIDANLDLPPSVRRRYPRTCWQKSRARVLEYARPIRGAEIDRLLARKGAIGELNDDDDDASDGGSDA